MTQTQSNSSSSSEEDSDDEEELGALIYQSSETAKAFAAAESSSVATKCNKIKSSDARTKRTTSMRNSMMPTRTRYQRLHIKSAGCSEKKDLKEEDIKPDAAKGNIM